jgi:hypothetical protein
VPDSLHDLISEWSPKISLWISTRFPP